MPRKKQRLDKIKCAWCNKVFKPTRWTQKYCCASHRQAAYEARLKQRNQPEDPFDLPF